MGEDAREGTLDVKRFPGIPIKVISDSAAEKKIEVGDLTDRRVPTRTLIGVMRFLGGRRASRTPVHAPEEKNNDGKCICVVL